MKKKANLSENSNTSSDSHASVRLDKWLWAARFYKTRSLAKDVIEKGKVKVNKTKTKPSREIKCGDTILIKQGLDYKEVTVKLLSETRGPAKEAEQLYQELTSSVQKRTEEKEYRRLAADSRIIGITKPNKKQRREISKVKRMKDI